MTAARAPSSNARADARRSRLDAAAALGLLLAAALVFGINLGVSPLRDWDEGTVAQVAREIHARGTASQIWPVPTLHGEPYVNKPPLVHWLIAGAFALGGVNEWTARLPGAAFGAVSVPLVYLLARAAFETRLPALLAAGVYLTLLPVVRHGRLAMLDAALLCFVALAFACLLRARTAPAFALGAGVALALGGLAKGPVVLVFAALAVPFVAWEARPLLRCARLWIGLALPVAVLAAWYGVVASRLGAAAVRASLVDQSLRRVVGAIEGNAGTLGYYVIEVLEYAWPWLLVLPGALALAWRARGAAWARLVLVWGGGYFVAISLAGTKLPWYAYPLWAPLAIAVGAYLAAVWRARIPIPRGLAVAVGLAAVIAAVACAGLGALGVGRGAVVAMGLMSAALTVSAVLGWFRDRSVVPVLLAGTYAALLVFFTSDHWVWELREDYPVPPVAALVRASAPDGTLVLTTHPSFRPSLDFYSNRRVVPATAEEIGRRWTAPARPYVLVPAPMVVELAPRLDGPVSVAGRAGDWVVITREP
jgi:4-amino-4-deoxy-L-arabinose transferase-like glycosyltransferase